MRGQGEPSSCGSQHSNVFMWLSTAEGLALQRLAAHCERFMAVEWERLIDQRPEQIRQLSISVIIRVTMGVSKSMMKLQDRLERLAHTMTDCHGSYVLDITGRNVSVI